MVEKWGSIESFCHFSTDGIYKKDYGSQCTHCCLGKKILQNEALLTHFSFPLNSSF